MLLYAELLTELTIKGYPLRIYNGRLTFLKINELCKEISLVFYHEKSLKTVLSRKRRFNGERRSFSDI